MTVIVEDGGNVEAGTGSFFGGIVEFPALLYASFWSGLGGATVKTVTMLLGEFDLQETILDHPEAYWFTSIVFVVFVINVCVVLMNLVLGLAISDIEKLRSPAFSLGRQFFVSSDER